MRTTRVQGTWGRFLRHCTGATRALRAWSSAQREVRESGDGAAWLASVRASGQVTRHVTTSDAAITRAAGHPGHVATTTAEAAAVTTTMPASRRRPTGAKRH